MDLRPWQTARELAGMAVTAEERQYAREAERLADHEVDQAFAAALRETTMQQHKLSGDALALSKKIAALRQTIRDDQARVDELTRAAAATKSEKANAAMPETTATDLDVAKAQLGLDSDELADAEQDFARLVGDKSIRIQQEHAAHEAEMKKYDAEVQTGGEAAVLSAQRRQTLASQIGAWLDQNTRARLIRQAMSQAQADASARMISHKRMQDAMAQTAGRNPQAANANNRMASLQTKRAESQLMAIYDDQMQAAQQLASVYGAWAGQVALQHQIASHLILRSLSYIILIVLCVIGVDALVKRLVNRPNLDRRRRQTLIVALRLGAQFTGLVLVLLVIFGAPNQMPTIVGLTTAGLTVVLQDFIIAFFGWFILMGKNGIRAGDWVEINGIGGEVVNVGLFRTTMLETGNWTDKGHPTGRRVTFINSFAIKGQFFNFSTTGQWMWDEITFTMPPAIDTYTVIEQIRQAVLQETGADARQAEEEWARVTRQSAIGLSHFTAGPALDMRPGLTGIDLIVRYVTRASHRFEVKNRLYQCVITLLHTTATAASPALVAPKS